VQSFVAGHTQAEYGADLFFRSAVERQVQIIGEAACGMSETFKRAHRENRQAQRKAQVRRRKMRRGQRKAGVASK
jgi:uncharacterized protein with HEPN domain